MVNIQTQNILILAHPGHELRIHHWMELNKPRVYFLTDGSGGREVSRTHYSRTIVEATGSTCGAVFGEIADKTWYSAFRDQDISFFRSVLDRIARDIPHARTIRIIADAVDGYNPVHDLASAMGVALQKKLTQRGVEASLAFSAAVPSATGDLLEEISLDAAARARKLQAIEKYTPLAEEVQRILEQDATALDREYIIDQNTDWRGFATPTWESIGRDRVLAGTYESCLTMKEHFHPVVQSLLHDLAHFEQAD